MAKNTHKKYNDNYSLVFCTQFDEFINGYECSLILSIVYNHITIVITTVNNNIKSIYELSFSCGCKGKNYNDNLLYGSCVYNLRDQNYTEGRIAMLSSNECSLRTAKGIGDVGENTFEHTQPIKQDNFDLMLASIIHSDEVKSIFSLTTEMVKRKMPDSRPLLKLLDNVLYYYPSQHLQLARIFMGKIAVPNIDPLDNIIVSRSR